MYQGLFGVWHEGILCDLRGGSKDSEAFGNCPSTGGRSVLARRFIRAWIQNFLARPGAMHCHVNTLNSGHIHPHLFHLPFRLLSLLPCFTTGPRLFTLSLSLQDDDQSPPQPHTILMVDPCLFSLEQDIVAGPRFVDFVKLTQVQDTCLKCVCENLARTI